MNSSNVTLHSELIIVGMPGLQQHYTALILVLVTMDHRLHTPMYFFLWNLAVLDILMTTSIIPKMLAVVVCSLKAPVLTISFAGCFLQMYFIISLGATETFLIAIMAYDRYAAVLKPLHYNTIMSPRVCITMASSAVLVRREVWEKKGEILAAVRWQWAL
ncbi:putative olfactory receptor 2W6 [Lepisosteus oculatus]|uniref:putative olfactory receptor 2W6 n=1 Tax=Lepisosteus oculatus TaxID=7918 RepID=UPI0035F4FF3D